MRNRKRIIAAMLMFSLASATSCGKDNTVSENGDVSYYTVSIDGEQVKADVSEEEITNLKDLSQGFIKAIITSDYKNPDVESEYKYYTKQVAKDKQEAGAPQATAETQKQYELVQEVAGCETNTIEFYRLNGQEAASVTSELHGVITHATDAYIQAVGIDQNVKYKRNVTVVFVLEEGQWKVVEYSATTREVA